MSLVALQPQQTSDEKRSILRRLPPGTTRVQVVDGDGKTRFRLPRDVGETDQIVMKPDGMPVVMQGSPGRKAKIELSPTDSKIAEVLEVKIGHMETHDMVTAAKDNPTGDSVLDYVLMAMADEATSLEFERKEAERNGRDTSAYSAKRARVLKSMADIWLKRRDKLDTGTINMDSPAFSVLMEFLLETIHDSMADARMCPEQIETVMGKMAGRFDDGWKEEARVRMKGK